MPHSDPGRFPVELSGTTPIVVSRTVRSAGPNVAVVIGAPHHAPAGVKQLPCGRPADQNTGFLGWRIAEGLDSPAVVAANATVDPNKSLDSGYSRAVSALAPSVLVEIHGHGGRRAKFDVEVSAGSRLRSSVSEAFAGELVTRMAAVPELASLSVSGDYASLYYKASRTATMQTAAWLGIHIELPLAVRKGSGGEPGLPPTGHALAVRLADVIEAWLPGHRGSLS